MSEEKMWRQTSCVETAIRADPTQAVDEGIAARLRVCEENIKAFERNASTMGAAGPSHQLINPWQS